MRIAIVGGGFSGTALAATLAPSHEVLWFERSGVFGAGLAYGTDDPNHLLNVPADKMSAFADAPDHFADWLVVRGIVSVGRVSSFFAPRRLYRAYLQSLDTGAAEKIAEEVVSLSEGVVVTPKGRYEADRVVLATGYLPETGCGVRSLAFDPGSWPREAVREVVLVGSGLTAVDVALSALARYPDARVTAISRSGRLPDRFEFGGRKVEAPPLKNPRDTLRWLRGGGDFAALRPHWESIWARSSVAEQGQFLRHLRARFDRMRHRMPPPSAEAIERYRAEGRFRLIAGTVVAVEDNVVVYEGGRLCADLTLDCSGQSPYWPKSQDPLVRQLLDSKQVLPGPHGMGIRMNTGWVHAVGPMLRGQRWETTAVAEIREQVAALRDELIPETYRAMSGT